MDLDIELRIALYLYVQYIGIPNPMNKGSKDGPSLGPRVAWAQQAMRCWWLGERNKGYGPYYEVGLIHLH